MRTRSVILLGLTLLGVLMLTGCSANPTQVVAQLIPVIAGLLPIVAGAAAALAPGEAAAVTTAQGLVSTALKALQDVLKEYESNPNDTTLAKVTSAFAAAHDNLAELLKAAAVKDVKTATKITAIVNGAVSTLAMLEANVLQKHPQTVAAAQAAQS